MTKYEEQKRRAANRKVAQDALVDRLEYDVIGVIDTADLTWDQRVQYSIALSLKAISDRLESNADEGRR